MLSLSTEATPSVGSGEQSRLIGLIVTYRRPDELAETLSRLAAQDRPLDRVVVIDNAADGATEDVVRSYPGAAEYVPVSENLGFAGGVSLGMEHVLRFAADDDWIVVLDDDDPPPSSNILAELEAFASEMRRGDPATAVVGMHGARFDWSKGQIVRIPDRELAGPVLVDYVGGNALPFFRVHALRKAGPFSRAIFFGLSEVEHGLRLRRAGFALYAHGDLWREARTNAGRLRVRGGPRYRLGVADWRNYYSLRNTIYILRKFGRRRTAIKVTLIRGLAKPLVNVVLSPRLAWAHLKLNARACRDGWTDRMGRTVEPEPWGRRSTKPPPRDFVRNT